MPPIGGLTIYIFGDVDAVSDPDKILTVRVHDECNGSDVFGSDICTCRPYLIHGISVSRLPGKSAGVMGYFSKEGRALGEVTNILSTIFVSVRRVVTRHRILFLYVLFEREARTSSSSFTYHSFV